MDNIGQTLAEMLELPENELNIVTEMMKKEIQRSMQDENTRGEIADLLLQFSDEDKKNIEELKKEIEENKNELNNAQIDFLQIIMDIVDGKITSEENLRDKVKIYIEFCNENAKLPTYANITDAGCDIYATENKIIEANQTTIIPTGLKIAIPINYVLSIRPRSGISSKTGLRIANSPGTIDSSYRDEIGIIIHNISSEPYEIKRGDRIAQFILEKAPMMDFQIVDSIENIGSNRGGGFGSSGR